jgi:hypothetical protein
MKGKAGSHWLAIGCQKTRDDDERHQERSLGKLLASVEANAARVSRELESHVG